MLPATVRVWDETWTLALQQGFFFDTTWQVRRYVLARSDYSFAQFVDSAVYPAVVNVVMHAKRV